MRRTALFLACLAFSAATCAQVTMVASLGKQILQNVVFGSVKNQLIGALAGMGCKGSAIAGLAAAAGAGSAARTTAGMRGPSLAGAAARPAGPAGTLAGTGAMDPAAMQKAMEMMQQQGAMSPEQQAMMQNAMAQLRSTMAQPLSRDETKAVFDEMAEIGLLTGTMRDEAKDCITYAPPGAGDSLGGAGAMIKNMVLPAARQAKERMAAASPEELSQLADGMVDALNSASAADRKAFLDGFGSGFFPAPVIEQVRGRIKP
ncbi:MAG TPA: hypothetical protein VFI80_11330 [Burkholderiales bacterium]|nr:hypothetical protein [Burkholderiales bacterium]